MMKETDMKREWKRLTRQEERFLKRNEKEPSAAWQDKIAQAVPEKLNDTLHTAFYKAFEMILEKGTGVIEKTCQKEKKEQNYKINAYAANVRDNRKSFQAFGKEAKRSQTLNTAVSAIGGIGMGLAGVGLPDIPIFLGVILKSIYEIALSYGYSYDTQQEQIFILKLIEAALSHETELTEAEQQINLWIQCQTQVNGAMGFQITREEQMRRTADVLANEMLYLKFVQGIPVVGVIGGLSDMVYQKKISDYAQLKYKRRFLLDKTKKIL